MSFSPNRATVRGSKPANAFLKASRLRRTMIQARPGLKPLQHQHLPERTAITLRHTPFRVVVLAHQRVVVRPETALWSATATNLACQLAHCATLNLYSASCLLTPASLFRIERAALR